MGGPGRGGPPIGFGPPPMGGPGLAPPIGGFGIPPMGIPIMPPPAAPPPAPFFSAVNGRTEKKYEGMNGVGERKGRRRGRKKKKRNKREKLA